MAELFDINLISQILGMDKKSSISKEQPNLKRKVAEDNRYKTRHKSDRRIVKNNDSHKVDEKNLSEENEDDSATIDITV